MQEGPDPKRDWKMLVINRAQHLGNLGVVQAVGIPHDADWNLGGDTALAREEVENSRLTSMQLYVCLSVAHKEDLDDILTSPGKNVTSESLQEMIDRKVLKGVRVLDLGCGTKPVLARMLRALGADVYTLDKVQSDAFVVAAQRAGNEWADLERKNHIVLDLTAADWRKEVESRSGGSFDVITSAHLSSFGGPDIEFHDVRDLLKDRGVFFKAETAISERSVQVK